MRRERRLPAHDEDREDAIVMMEWRFQSVAPQWHNVGARFDDGVASIVKPFRLDRLAKQRALQHEKRYAAILFTPAKEPKGERFCNGELQRKRVVGVYGDGRRTDPFISMADAAKAFGVTPENLSAAVRRNCRAGGMYWDYADKPRDHSPKPKPVKEKVVRERRPMGRPCVPLMWGDMRVESTDRLAELTQKSYRQVEYRVGGMFLGKPLVRLRPQRKSA